MAAAAAPLPSRLLGGAGPLALAHRAARLTQASGVQGRGLPSARLQREHVQRAVVAQGDGLGGRAGMLPVRELVGAPAGGGFSSAVFWRHATLSLSARQDVRACGKCVRGRV